MINPFLHISQYALRAIRVGFFGTTSQINESNGSDVKAAAYEEILRYLDISIYSYSKNRKSAIIVDGTDKMTDDEIKLGSANRKFKNPLSGLIF